MNTTFNTLFSNAKQVAFNHKWWSVKYKNFNACVTGEDAIKLKCGEIVSCIDSFGRKMVIIGTNNFENVVLYECYSKSNKHIIISSETFEFNQLVKLVTDRDISGVLDELSVLAIYETISRDMIENIESKNQNTKNVFAWAI